MNRTVLQIPMDRSLRKQAERAAEEQGFSTLQDFTRLILHKLAKEEIRVSVEPTILRVTKEELTKMGIKLKRSKS